MYCSGRLILNLLHLRLGVVYTSLICIACAHHEGKKSVYDGPLWFTVGYSGQGLFFVGYYMICRALCNLYLVSYPLVECNVDRFSEI